MTSANLEARFNEKLASEGKIMDGAAIVNQVPLCRTS
jgi:hypothetical protein